MGINMDIRNEPKYSFLDLRDLTEADKNEIAEILRLDASLVSLKLPWDIGEKEYEINEEIIENPCEDTTDQWQQYGVAEGIPSYDACDVQSAPMMTATITSGHPYPGHPQMIYTVGEFSPMANPYANSAAGDPNAYSYISRIQYGPPPAAVYSSSQPELASQQPQTRENERRGQRNRGGGSGGGGGVVKRGDSYNRQMNSNNEMQTGYIVQGQPQYGQILCHPSSGLYPVSAQSHPVTGTQIFIQPSPNSPYPQGPRMHRNGHPSYSYPSHSHATSSGAKYSRNSTGQTTYYPESPKNLHKHHDKRTNQQQQRDPPPPFRHASGSDATVNNNNNTNNNDNDEAESPKRNCSKASIVNNGNANIEAKSSSVLAKPSDDRKVTTNHVKSQVSDVRIKEERNEDKKENKKDIVAVNIDNEDTIIAPGDKIVPAEKEIVRVDEEKSVSSVKISEVSSRTMKILENATTATAITTATTTTMTTMTTISNEETIAKSPESATSVVVSTVSLNTSAAVAPSWANVCRRGQSSDVKSPTPITKLPVACVPPIHFPTVTVESTTTKVIPTAEVVSKNQHFVIIGNRNSLEATTKNVENSARTDNKSLTETARNDPNDPTIFKMGDLLLKYQMDKQTVSLLPRGLTNRSNYCYINGILQALLACPPFYNLLMALPYPKNTMKNSSTPLIDNMVRFVREFIPLSESARMPRKDKSQKRGEETAVDVQCGVAFEPSYVYTMLKNTSCAGVFSVEGRQEDAEEFLSCLLNGISDEMLELMKLVNSESSDTGSDPTESDTNFSNAEEGWKVMGPKNKGSITRCTEIGRTPLSDIFRGQLRSRVLRTGDESTDNVQPFFTLQLDIEKAGSVDEALEILVGKDQVEGMTCSKTKQQIEAWKQVLLEELPVILILHLKWFDYKLDGCSKIFKRVEFPIDLKLDGKLLSPNVAKKLTRKQKQYKLFAVTYHDGKEASKGHYVTDAFHVGYNAWVRYDDSSVKGIYEKDVLNPSPPRVPYLLYYRRCDTIGNNPPITARTR